MGVTKSDDSPKQGMNSEYQGHVLYVLKSEVEYDWKVLMLVLIEALQNQARFNHVSAPQKRWMQRLQCHLQVAFEESASSFRQHLTSFINKWSPRCFKGKLITFWDSAQNTEILNIKRKRCLSCEDTEPSPPPTQWEEEKKRTRWSFQLHQYSLIHRESWQQVLDCITGWMFSFVTVRSVWNGILNWNRTIPNFYGLWSQAIYIT